MNKAPPQAPPAAGVTARAGGAQMFFDDLPIWGFIGKVEKLLRPGEKPELRFYLFTHIHFDIHYNEDRVIEARGAPGGPGAVCSPSAEAPRIESVGTGRVSPHAFSAPGRRRRVVLPALRGRRMARGRLLPVQGEAAAPSGPVRMGWLAVACR